MSGIRGGRWLIVIGVLLTVAAVYVLSGPGRIDIIDGQLRYDVTESLLTIGQPVLRDPALLRLGIPGVDGRVYAFYNAAPSVVAMPLVWIGGLVSDPRAETRRFLFSLTCAVFGALVAALLCAFYLALGVAPAASVGWTLVSAFTTLLSPLSPSTFDQTQHAFFALLSLFLGWLSAQRESVILAATAGLVAGVLINYQESYVLVLPALAVSTLGPRYDGAPRGLSSRSVVFLLATGVGIGLWLLFNQIRFESPLISGKSAILERVALPS